MNNEKQQLNENFNVLKRYTLSPSSKHAVLEDQTNSKYAKNQVKKVLLKKNLILRVQHNEPISLVRLA